MADGHFSDFDQSLLEEDMVVQASMGPVTDRSQEQLCSSVGLVHSQTPGVVRPLDAVTEADAGWREMA